MALVVPHGDRTWRKGNYELIFLHNNQDVKERIAKLSKINVATLNSRNVTKLDYDRVSI